MESGKKILIAWSNYYEDLAEKQLKNCILLLQNKGHSFKIETIAAGTYEIPAVMAHYHRHKPFDGYIALGLLLKGGTDHYDFIWEHVNECFIRFTMDGMNFGNGIISTFSKEQMIERVESGERVAEACRAVDYLIQLKHNLTKEH